MGLVSLATNKLRPPITLMFDREMLVVRNYVVKVIHVVECDLYQAFVFDFVLVFCWTIKIIGNMYDR